MARNGVSNLIRSGANHLISRSCSSVSGYSSFRSEAPRRLYPSTKSLYTSSILTTFQKRWASHSPKLKMTAKSALDRVKDIGVAYHGPISSTIKKVKLLSLSTCCLSVSLGPVITFMTSPEMNIILKGGVASTVIFFSASTTAILHWFVSPYIHKIRWQPGSDTFEAEMMSWLATPLTKTIKFADIRVADTNRPFVTFKANDNFYFVDADHCQNKALLAKLTPQKPTHESALRTCD
ncbi:Transmembrane protein 70-like protein mitochondrial [Bienertia sinuspersici]